MIYTTFNPVIPTRHNFRILTGQIYGRLTVISIHSTNAKGQVIWLCLCKCGNPLTASTARLNYGCVRSCGCLQTDLLKQTKTIHGDNRRTGKTPEYRAYTGAKTRCNNPKEKCYPQYGGRGIKFLFDSYSEFLATVGRKPTPRHSLDRIDVNGNYEPGNIRWANSKQQGRNKRNSQFITANGQTKTVAEWSEEKGGYREQIRRRIHRDNWCSECAVNIPPNGVRCVHKSTK